MSTNTLPPLTGKKSPELEPNRMEITIHVCDDSKNLKKDFTCPRDLLLHEMRYFQDYLSSDIQKWEDVDISVHCDIKIFDWLIHYVKRDESPEGSSLALDKNNAVSILISSDFLKMDQLVEHCINFCHDNMSAIISTPCNMNCINDKLVNRIAQTFDQHELEAVKDKKDKFKGKLFTKKIEQLFDPKFASSYSPNNGAYLYKCVYCSKLLLPTVEEKIECVSSRLWIDNRGSVKYIHLRDPGWDVGEFILSIKATEKHWRNVFWKLWALINHLKCSVCQVVFPLCDFRGCRYHPQSAALKVDSEGNEKRMYGCCEQPVIFFEPIKTQTGCEHREHTIDPSDPLNNLLGYSDAALYNELMTVVDIVCQQKPAVPRTHPQFYRLDSAERKELQNVTYQRTICKEEKSERKRSPSQRRAVPGKHSFTPKQKLQSVDHGEEDNSDDDETGVIRVVLHQKESPMLSKNNSCTWNSELPLRLNQDVQRENDVKRMKLLMENLRLNKGSSDGDQKGDVPESGLFTRIESKYRLYCTSQSSVVSSNPTSSQGNRRAKIGDR